MVAIRSPKSQIIHRKAENAVVRFAVSAGNPIARTSKAITPSRIVVSRAASVFSIAPQAALRSAFIDPVATDANIHPLNELPEPPNACPTILVQPENATACPSGSAAFSVVASGAPPLTYQWHIETSPGVWQGMGNDPGPLPCGGGAFSYAQPINSADVNVGVHPCPGVTAYQIRCVVTNSCGSVTSNEATLIQVTKGDMNCDCRVDNFDIDPFVLALVDPTGYAAMYPTCDRMHGDASDDGMFNNFDIDPFVTCILSADGYCP